SSWTGKGCVIPLAPSTSTRSDRMPSEGNVAPATTEEDWTAPSGEATDSAGGAGGALSSRAEVRANARVRIDKQGLHLVRLRSGSGPGARRMPAVRAGGAQQPWAVAAHASQSPHLARPGRGALPSSHGRRTR